MRLGIYANNLELLVEERTHELLEAEQITAAGRVAAMVGHDLRAPLQTINNAIYWLKRTPDKSDETLNMAEGAVKRATQMLEELRHNTRDSPLNTVTTDIAAFIREAVEETQIPGSVDMALEFGDGAPARTRG